MPFATCFCPSSSLKALIRVAVLACLSDIDRYARCERGGIITRERAAVATTSSLDVGEWGTLVQVFAWEGGTRALRSSPDERLVLSL